MCSRPYAKLSELTLTIAPPSCFIPRAPARGPRDDRRLALERERRPRAQLGDAARVETHSPTVDPCASGRRRRRRSRQQRQTAEPATAADGRAGKAGTASLSASQDDASA